MRTGKPLAGAIKNPLVTARVGPGSASSSSVRLPSTMLSGFADPVPARSKALLPSDTSTWFHGPPV
jgi:hypothetical protein